MVVVFVFWFNRSADFKDFVSLYRVLAAYSHVRTEPLARHRPDPRKKKYGEHVLRSSDNLMWHVEFGYNNGVFVYS